MLVVTGCAVVFAAGRAYGVLSVLAFLSAPWPVIGYIRVIRRMMNRAKADFQRRSHVVNLMCVLGLALAVIATMTLLGAGIASLKCEPPFLAPRANWNIPN